jgi:hypothetical protein
MSKIYSITLKHHMLAFGVAAACWGPPASAAALEPAHFASPQQAVDALVAALRADNATALLALFGSDGQKLVSSGDQVADRQGHAKFVESYHKASHIVRVSPGKAVLVIDTTQWPFPIPIVFQNGAWQFDTKAGAEEILDRRIGRNELDAISACHGYVDAQRDYAHDMQNDKKPLEYAQKFISTNGMHDGLYWPVKLGEIESPIGPQMANAKAEGYVAGPPGESGPYHGYYFKILTRQGAAAPGGARDDMAGSHLTGGFAMIAYPAAYGDSGIMSFIVSQDDIVYQKDLGPGTAAAAAAINEFNPDLSWHIP